MHFKVKIKILFALTALSATWSEQDVEVMLAIFATLKFVKDSIRKGTETLSTPLSEKCTHIMKVCLEGHDDTYTKHSGW